MRTSDWGVRMGVGGLVGCVARLRMSEFPTAGGWSGLWLCSYICVWGEWMGDLGFEQLAILEGGEEWYGLVWL